MCVPLYPDALVDVHTDTSHFGPVEPHSPREPPISIHGGQNKLRSVSALWCLHVNAAGDAF